MDFHWTEWNNGTVVVPGGSYHNKDKYSHTYRMEQQLCVQRRATSKQGKVREIKMEQSCGNELVNEP